MKKWLKILIIALALITGLLMLARGITGEDTWICEDGEWIKHGNPSPEMPQKDCD